MNKTSQSATYDTWIIYFDGSCIPNPESGGSGVFALRNGDNFVCQGEEPAATNSRMQLMAAVTGLEALDDPSDVHIISDSEYVVKGITERIDVWKAKGWRSADRKPFKNRDLWERLDHAVQRHQVKFTWVRAHDGNPGNERAHQLAEAAARRQAARRPSNNPHSRHRATHSGNGLIPYEN